MTDHFSPARFAGPPTRVRVNSEFLGVLTVVLLVGSLWDPIEDGIDADDVLAVIGGVIGLVFFLRTRKARQDGVLSGPLTSLLWSFLGVWTASIVASLVIWETLTVDAALGILLVLTATYLMLQLRADLEPGGAPAPPPEATGSAPQAAQPMTAASPSTSGRAPTRGTGSGIAPHRSAICPRCGGTVSPGWSFCGVCGAGLASSGPDSG